MISAQKISPNYAIGLSLLSLTALCTIASFRPYVSRNEALFVFSLVAIALFAFQNLRKAGYSSPTTAAILLCFSAQLAFLQLLPSGGKACLFALNIYLIATAALRFVADQTARAIIVLSCALASVQLFIVFGMITSTLLVPVYAGAAFAEASARQRSGLCILLIFIPLAAVAATFLLPEIFGRMHVGADSRHPSNPFSYELFALLSVACASPILVVTVTLRHLRSIPGFLVLATALAVCSTLVIEHAMRGTQNFALVMAALIAGALAVISTWRPTAGNSALAIASAALGAVLSAWLAAGAVRYL